MNTEEIRLLDSIDKNLKKFRDLLIKNTDFLLNKSKTDFNIFCCSLDSMEDSFLAIEFYFKNGIGTNIGEQYLKLWGLLQAIIMQQDAIKELYKLLKIQYQNPAFKNIRDIRIKIAGHPTSAKNGKLLCYTTRCLINNESIDAVIYNKEDSCDDCVHIQYRTLIIEYLTEFDNCLRDLIKLNKSVEC